MDGGHLIFDHLNVEIWLLTDHKKYELLLLKMHLMI